MSVSFYINGRPVLHTSDCQYSADCPLIQYIKREKFLCNITKGDNEHTNVNLTVFYTDEVATNLWTIHNTHKKTLQMVKSNQHAL